MKVKYWNFFSLGALLLNLTTSATKAEYILYVPSTEECPKYTERIDEKHCKPFVSNKITGAAYSGRCPAGSSNIGSGYCMYSPEHREQEIWLSCTEEYGKRGNEQVNSFYLKINRIEDNKLNADYIDAYNSTNTTAKETSIAFNFSSNVYPTANRRRIVQAIYSINKQTLEFSKITRHFHSTPLRTSPEYMGGISIQNAGACKKLNQKPQSLM